MATPDAATVPRWVNAIVGTILRSPLHRTMSRKTILLTVTGRRSGKTYTFPVRYLRDGDALTVFSGSAWSWNLDGGAPVELVLQGRRRSATARRVVADEATVRDNLVGYLRLRPREAKYYGITLGPDGRPDPGDLARAARSTRMIHIQPA